jgi:hypothetical protein
MRRIAQQPIKGGWQFSDKPSTFSLTAPEASTYKLGSGRTGLAQGLSAR